MFQSTPGVGAAAGVGAAGGAGGPNVREVTYRVKVVADTTQYNAAISQMGQYSQQAAQAAGGYHQRTGIMPAGMSWQPGTGYVPTQGANGLVAGYGGMAPPGGGGKGGGGGGDAGAMASLGYFVARLGTAVTFIVTALEKFQTAVNAVSTSMRGTTNAAAKIEAWGDVVPVVGPAAAKGMVFGASLQERWGMNGGNGYLATAGATGSLGRVQGKLQGMGVPDWLAGVAGEFISAEGEYNAAQDRTFLTTFDLARSAAANQARSRRGDLNDAYQQMEFSTAASLQDAREQSRLMFARGAEGSAPFQGATGRSRFDKDNGYDAVIRGAERGRATAGNARWQAARERIAASGATRDAAAEVNRAPFAAAQRRVEDLAERAKTDPTAQIRLGEAMGDAERESAKLAEQLARYQKALNTEKEKTVQLAQAEYELGQRSLAVQQAKLTVLDDKMRKNDAGAESFAFMGPAQQQSLVDAARRLKEEGFENLSPRQRELLGGSSITSDFLRKSGRDFANSDNATRGQLDELFKLTGQQTRRELMDERMKIQAEIEVQVVVNQEKLTTAMRDAFRKLDPELRKLIEDGFKLNVGKTKREEAAARAQNK